MKAKADDKARSRPPSSLRKPLSRSQEKDAVVATWKHELDRR
jgi:hypothetical protein